jgi:hypothetical protein
MLKAAAQPGSGDYLMAALRTETLLAGLSFVAWNVRSH